MIREPTKREREDARTLLAAVASVLILLASALALVGLYHRWDEMHPLVAFLTATATLISITILIGTILRAFTPTRPDTPEART